MKRALAEGRPRHTGLALIAITVFALQVPCVLAQDRSYSYDKAGNLQSIGNVNTNSDPLNCGAIGNQCDGGSGSCVAGKCVPPPCNSPSCASPTNPPPTPVTLYCTTGHCNPPVQPKLMSGGLHGHQLCSPLNTDGTTFTFGCEPLPSNSDSGWQLTPTYIKGGDGKCHPNEAVVLKVTAPTQTELFIEFETSSGSTVPQTQVTRQPGDAEVKVVGQGGQVAEVMTDDAYTRTWTLQFLVSTSRDASKVNIYNVGSSGTVNGAKGLPIHVWFLRDPQDPADLSSCN